MRGYGRSYPNGYHRPQRRSYGYGRNNLEYYINGRRVTKQEMAVYLSNRYHVPQNVIIKQRTQEAKSLMRANNCMAWSFPDGTTIKY